MGHFLWSPSLFFFFICHVLSFSFFFFFNDTATTEIYTLSLHDALPISASEVANACVNVQGAAAPLFGRDRHFAAVAGQHTDRRIIHTGKGKVCNTAGKEGHTVTPRTDRRDHGPQALREKRPLHPGSEASDARQATRKKLEQSRGEYQLLQPRPLEEAKELACQLETPAVREDLVEEQTPEETF